MSANASKSKTASPPGMLVIDPATDQIKEYKKRKAHKKDRSGCLPCKAKRVKCERTRPVCVRCQRNGRTCIYDSDSSTVATPSEEFPSRAQTERRQALPRSISCQPLTPSPDEPGTPSATLFHHIYSNWELIFGFPRARTPLHLSHAHTCIRHSLLVVSACHLRHVVPDSSMTRLAEHFHLSLALRDYQKALDRPLNDVDQDMTDVLLMTAMLLNASSFALPPTEDPGLHQEPEVGESWVFKPSQASLGWLSMQMGLKPLLIATNRWQHRSAFRPAFQGFDYSKATIKAEFDSIPNTWQKLLGLDVIRDSDSDRDTTGELADRSDSAHIFLEPALSVAKLRDLEPTTANIYRYLQFLGKLDPEFRALLFHRDRRALWLFGYWLGLMHRYNWLWWCDRRTRRDFAATRMWLEQELAKDDGEDGRVWDDAMADLKASLSLAVRLKDQGSVEEAGTDSRV